MWPLTFGLQSTKQTNAQASAWFLRSAWNIICLAICDILPWSKTFHRCKTYISFSLYNRAFGWEPIGYKTVLGCKIHLTQQLTVWVSICMPAALMRFSSWRPNRGSVEHTVQEGTARCELLEHGTSCHCRSGNRSHYGASTAHQLRPGPGWNQGWQLPAPAQCAWILVGSLPWMP